MTLEAGTTEAEIEASIEKVIGRKRVSVWIIGTTDNLELRHQKHGRPAIWHYWKPDSEQIASNVVAYFKEKGMKVYTDKDAGANKATFVYLTMFSLSEYSV
jgi:hypothetical protein